MQDNYCDGYESATVACKIRGYRWTSKWTHFRTSEPAYVLGSDVYCANGCDVIKELECSDPMDDKELAVEVDGELSSEVELTDETGALFAGLDGASTAAADTPGPFRDTFYNPEFAQRRIDRCLLSHDYCGGQEAATVTCKILGFRKATSFELKWQFPPTYNLGSDSSCSRYCDFLSQVKCKD